MKRYLLFYEKVADYAERQGPFVAAHRDYIQQWVSSRATLLLGGSLEDGSAVLLFGAESAAEAEEFASADPYVVHGIVARWRVSRWDTVVGTLVVS